MPVMMTTKAAVQGPATGIRSASQVDARRRGKVGHGPSNQGVQARFRIGPADDPLEREADRVAEQVLRGDAVGPLGGVAEHPQRKCAACEAEEETLRRQVDEEEEEELQLKPEAGGPRAAGADAAAAAVARGGRPLSPAERAYFEPRFGRDFLDVRVHDDPRAHSAAAAINARAFTLGSHVAFAGGEYRPGTPTGRRLLAHELAHTVQQTDRPGAGQVQRQGGGGPSGGAGASPIYHRCVTVLGCNAIEHCDGRPCAVSACGRGSCRHWLCRLLGMENLLVRAWCVYNCLPSGSAIVFYSALGNFKIGPFCLDE